ncbi:MAG: hypothetical protein K6U02_07335 [Firmicutes bacterium]|nr:hypothetical protein [Bacillota bacterium]
MGEYPTIRYAPPKEDLVIDLMARLGDAWRYEDPVANTLLWHDVKVRVASPKSLYKK